MKKLMIVMIGWSLFLEAGFYRNGSTNIVSDTKTLLQWQDNINVQYTWNDAIDYCRDLALGGHNDWRLPNINELSTLVDYTKASPSMSNVFAYNKSEGYWSSTSNVNNNTTYSEAWGVYFFIGSQSQTRKYYNLYVRCVRAGE